MRKYGCHFAWYHSLALTPLVLLNKSSSSCVAGQQAASPKKTVQNTVQASICFDTESQIVTGENFCMARRDAVSEKKVKGLKRLPRPNGA